MESQKKYMCIPEIEGIKMATEVVHDKICFTIIMLGYITICTINATTACDSCLPIIIIIISNKVPEKFKT